MAEVWFLIFLLGNNPEYQSGGSSQWKPAEVQTQPAPQGAVVGLPSKEACLRAALILENSFPSAITRCIQKE